MSVAGEVYSGSVDGWDWEVGCRLGDLAEGYVGGGVTDSVGESVVWSVLY